MVSDIYTNLPVNIIVRLLHPRSGDSHGQETFLASSADKQTRNYDADCSNHHLSLSTLESKGIDPRDLYITLKGFVYKLFETKGPSFLYYAYTLSLEQYSIINILWYNIFRAPTSSPMAGRFCA